MNYLSNLTTSELHGKRVLVRLDLNVPVGDEGHVMDTDADRIKKSLPTIEFLRDAGARVIIISHIGRDPGESLRPVVQKMEEFMTVGFAPSLLGDETKSMIDGMANGSVIVLENLRSDTREEQNDEAFAQELADYADLYVNDAFAASHRAHASLVGVPKLLPSYAGFQMQKEIENLSQAFNPSSPSILVLGGAKFETKLPVITKFLAIVDRVVIGGALANNFFRAQGYEIGKSLFDDTADVSSLLGHPKLFIPDHVVVENERGREEKSVNAVESGDKIVDIAPDGFAAVEDEIREANFVLWNGPMGNYENGFTTGSESIARLIANTAESFETRRTIVGGGDSVALMEHLGIADQFSFVSTGGGAMLEYLANGTLPGIEALG